MNYKKISMETQISAPIPVSPPPISASIPLDYSSKIIRLIGSIGRETTQKVAEWLTNLYKAPIHKLDSNVKYERRNGILVPEVDEITIEINSWGGDCDDGFVAYDMLKSVPKDTKIITIVTGYAASAASVIFCAGDDRYITSGSQLLIHQACFPFMVYMREEDMKVYTENLIKCNNRIVDTYAKVTGKSKSAIRKDIQVTDKMLIGQEAIDYGLANKMLFVR